jgi:rare lipoprotein A (peptidoglycan hydrolase)
MSAFVLSAALILSLILNPAIIAGGVTESDARAEVDAANADLTAATNQYQDMTAEVDRIDAKIAALEQEMTSMTGNYDQAATALDRRMKAIYKYSDFSAIELMLASRDFNDFSQRIALLSRLAYSDNRLMRLAANKKAETQKMEDQLADEKDNRMAALADLGGTRRNIESRLRDKESALADAQKTPDPGTGVTGDTPAPQAPAGGSLTGHSETGDASYYTYTGGYTAAHKTLPMGTMVRVTNLGNGAQVWVEIVDRGPWGPGRIIDLEETAFAQIGDLSEGVLFVMVEW